MKNDFDVIEYQFRDSIKIIPIADMHCGSVNFNIKQWKKFKDYVLSNNDIYIVIVGDLIDNQTKNSHSPFNVSVIDVFCKLDIEDKYRPNMAFFKVQIGERNEHNRQTYTFGIIHGSGGGTLTGGAINKNERFGYVIEGLDCLISAHVHKPAITKPSRLVVDTRNNKVSFKPFYQIIATSWLDYGGYALAKQLNPSSHMHQEIILTKERTKKLELKLR